MAQTPVIAEPATRRTRSYSQITDYLKCGWAFYLKRIRKMPQAQSVWLAGGTAFHLASEALDREWFEKGPAESADVYVAEFEKQFAIELDQIRLKEPDEMKWRTAGKPTKARPNGEDQIWWLEAGKQMVRDYYAWRISTEDILTLAAVEGGPAIEVEIRTLLGGVPTVAYVDRVFQDTRSGVLEVVDMKSGARPITSPDQLGHYSVMLAEKQMDVTYGSYYSARKGAKTEPFNLTGYTPASVGEMYRWVDDRINAGVFEPSITPLCKTCSVKKFCEFQGGVLPPATEEVTA